MKIETAADGAQRVATAPADKMAVGSDPLAVKLFATFFSFLA